MRRAMIAALLLLLPAAGCGKAEISLSPGEQLEQEADTAYLRQNYEAAVEKYQQAAPT